MLTLDLAAPQAPYRHPWRNAISVGRAFDLTRADLQRHLSDLQRRFGYRFCRFHAVFDDDMAVVVRGPDGGITYQWHHVDLVYDFLLSIGLKPFVELNPMPKLLASGPQTMFAFAMNVTPPRDPAQWEALVEAFLRHCVARYGMTEVRSWYVEVWNEPNLPGFWGGTQEDYWTLYDASARAVKRVDAQIRIGGPASSKANWIEDTIRHCDATGVPLDFVSTHLYHQDEHVAYPDPAANPHQRGMFFLDTVREVQATVERLRPGLEIHWTEWNAMSCRDAASVDWTYNPTNDSLHGAATVVRTCLELDAAADTLCWWVASDIFAESGIASSPFSMTYGLVTVHGIAKATCRAFELLARLQGDRLPMTADQAPRPRGAVWAAARDGDRTRVLIAHHVILDAPEGAWHETVRIPLPAGTWRLLTTRIAGGQGSCYESWLAMGAPQDLAPAEVALLRAHSEPAWSAELVTVGTAGLELPIHLHPGEVLLLEVAPPGQRVLPRRGDAKALAAWNQAMGATSR